MFGLANHDAGLVGEFDVSLLSSTHDVPWHSAEKPFEEADCEKEPEMQIGMPTDVKHVAHIGWDGPASASPSWMNEFPASTESSSEPLNQAMGNPAVISKAKAKTQKPSEEPLDSPTQRNSTKTKQSRRNITSSNSLVDSPGRDSSKPRRPKTSSNLGSDTPSQEPSGIGPSKKSNRKKSKGSGGGSTKSARSNAPEQMGENFPFSDPGTGYGSKNDGLKSILEGHDEGKECDEISRGFRAL